MPCVCGNKYNMDIVQTITGCFIYCSTSLPRCCKLVINDVSEQTHAEIGSLIVYITHSLQYRFTSDIIDNHFEKRSILTDTILETIHQTVWMYVKSNETLSYQRNYLKCLIPTAPYVLNFIET